MFGILSLYHKKFFVFAPVMIPNRKDVRCAGEKTLPEEGDAPSSGHWLIGSVLFSASRFPSVEDTSFDGVTILLTPVSKPDRFPEFRRHGPLFQKSKILAKILLRLPGDWDSDGKTDKIVPIHGCMSRMRLVHEPWRCVMSGERRLRGKFFGDHKRQGWTG
ncbi:MAG: Hypothetical protein C75L2_00780003 [Leptospirillum sp. Group II 'C75']|jgi:hypothetical protein|uniref:hypothetical protein n=1 Tax=Leptospirillum sp. Group II 'CF-1' TaxID=1660083 RepID=UPI00029CD51E|nr:hypothetical protein [Leptospirillum sp. Group II 'CF-1']AKS23007.1 hypothetical protein ABH19_03435 [Leptospirillum sp. Group II 'CF-1']EIJ75803.1 MAG: Hypothetical protein C75L2_00780003 [Leptospirillum sp. Group II 'C75']